MNDAMVKAREREIFKNFMDTPVCETAKKSRLTNINPLSEGQRNAYLAGYENGVRDVDVALFGDKNDRDQLNQYMDYTMPKSNFGKNLGRLCLMSIAAYGVVYLVEKHMEKKALKEQLKVSIVREDQNKED